MMRTIRTKRWALLKGWGLLAVAAGCGVGSYAAAAETYPVKPVRIIAAFSPGGFVDLTARLVAGPLSIALGQQVVVENRAGAGGIVGTEMVAHAAPDGYTLTVGSAGTHGVNQSLYPKLSYNVLRDFQPVARLSDAPSILAVHPSLPVRSVKDLIALARSKPGQIMYASAGAGTSTHLAAALFEHLARVKLLHVPYKGGGPAMIAVVAGEIPVTFGTAASVSPHTRSGRLRGLAVTGGQRSALLPELPTIAESGLPGYEMLNWLGMFAPAGTPRAVVEKLSSELVRIVRMPEVSGALQTSGAEPSPLGPDDFAAFVKTEVEKWAKVVAATGMTAN
jgi:tripartite-type tricarboxylate transporter receptor subunit TctC